MNRPKGSLYAQFLASCGRCADYDTEPAQLDAVEVADARRELRKKGWDYCRQYGWICPDCKKEMQR